MQSATVCKFGGSSLADAECFRRVGDIIRADRNRRYIVVSAPGRRSAGDIKVTDLLIAASESAGDERRAPLDIVRAKFRAIARELGLEAPEAALKELDAAAAAGRDAAASRGEYICARLMADYLQLPFVDAAGLFVFKSGVLDISSTYERLRGLGPQAVIPGFYGADPSGNIVTFPRGGSDISAAHLAAALKARLYENWTDVDGFFTADPSLVPGAQPIRCMSCQQARLFAYLGAGVLHYESIAPAAEAGIPLLVKNTFSPEAPGTLICPGARCETPCVAARRNGCNTYLLSAANLNAMQLESALAALPDGSVRNGIFTLECHEDMLKNAAQALHAACFG